jgi:hypothetical protein
VLSLWQGRRSKGQRRPLPGGREESPIKASRGSSGEASRSQPPGSLCSVPGSPVPGQRAHRLGDGAAERIPHLPVRRPLSDGPRRARRAHEPGRPARQPVVGERWDLAGRRGLSRAGERHDLRLAGQVQQPIVQDRLVGAPELRHEYPGHDGSVAPVIRTRGGIQAARRSPTPQIPHA